MPSACCAHNQQRRLSSHRRRRAEYPAHSAGPASAAMGISLLLRDQAQESAPEIAQQKQPKTRGTRQGSETCKTAAYACLSAGEEVISFQRMRGRHYQISA